MKYRDDRRKYKIAYALAKRMIHDNLGRWCEITMKRDGKQYKVIRDGYGPMEYPERDECRMVDKASGEVIAECENLFELAEKIIEMGY